MSPSNRFKKSQIYFLFQRKKSELSRLVEIVAARLNLGKQPNTETDTDAQMLNRSSLPSGYTSGMQASDPYTSYSGDGQASANIRSAPSGDGQASRRHASAPFVPDYSGDGHGRKNGWSGDGRGNDAMPVWSQDSRHQVANPLMPAYGRADLRAPVASSPAVQATEPHVSAVNVPLSEELTMNVNVPNQVEPSAPLKTKTTKNRDTWKLVALVFVFLVWVSTASTLLFLYMDRYLFP